MAECPECEQFKINPARYRWCANLAGDIDRTNSWRRGQGLPPLPNATPTAPDQQDPTPKNHFRKIIRGSAGYNAKTVANAGIPVVHTPPPETGPGTELKKMLNLIGLGTFGGCGCNGMARKMNEWGPQGCREHFDEIHQWLKNAARTTKWKAYIKAGWNAVTNGIPVTIDGLIHEAIRRAEQ